MLVYFNQELKDNDWIFENIQDDSTYGYKPKDENYEIIIRASQDKNNVWADADDNFIRIEIKEV